MTDETESTLVLKLVQFRDITREINKHFQSKLHLYRSLNTYKLCDCWIFFNWQYINKTLEFWI